MTLSLQFIIIFCFVIWPTWLSHAVNEFFGVKLHSNLGSFLTKEVPFLFLFFCLLPLIIVSLVAFHCLEIDPWTPIAYLLGTRNPGAILDMKNATWRWIVYLMIYYSLIAFWCWIFYSFFGKMNWYKKVLQSIGIWQPFLQDLQDEIREYNKSNIERNEKNPTEPAAELGRFCEIDISCVPEGNTIYSGTLVGISDVGTYQGILMRHVTIHITKVIEEKNDENNSMLISLKTERYSEKNLSSILNPSNPNVRERSLGQMFFPKEKIVTLHFRSKRSQKKTQKSNSSKELLQKISEINSSKGVS